MSVFAVLVAASLTATGGSVLYHLRCLVRELRLVGATANEPPAVLPVLKSTPLVSALIPTFHPTENLPALVRNFNGIEYPNKELILAVGGAHKLADYQYLAAPGVTLVDYRHGGKTAALKLCMDAAKSDIFFLSDADCRFNTESFILLLAPIINEGAPATGGHSEIAPGQHINLLLEIQLAHQRPRRPLSRSSGGGFLIGGNSFVTRETIEKIGGFDPNAFSDDYDMSRRLQLSNVPVLRIPGAYVETPYPDNVRAYLRRVARWTKAAYLDAPRLRHYSYMIGTLRSSLLGLVMLVVTASLPFTWPWGLFVLLPPLTYSYLGRLRRILQATKAGLFRLRPVHFFAALWWSYLDYMTSARALIEYLIPPLRRRW